MSEPPKFTTLGNLLNCEEACPWFGRCQGHKCPTRETYQAELEKSMREVVND